MTGVCTPCDCLQVIKETSALTFMIAGTVKEVVTVITAVIVFGDQFGLINGIGLVIVIGGVLLFNWYKLRKLKQSVRQQLASRDEAAEVSVDGVPIHVLASADGSPANRRVSSPAAVRASSHAERIAGSPRFAGNFSGQGSDALSFTKRRSSVEEAEAAEVMKALEFEPLLPLRV